MQVDTLDGVSYQKIRWRKKLPTFIVVSNLRRWLPNFRKVILRVTLMIMTRGSARVTWRQWEKPWTQKRNPFLPLVKMPAMNSVLFEGDLIRKEAKGL